MNEINRLSKTMTIDGEEAAIIDKFRHMRKQAHGEMVVAVRNGKMVKLWTTDKWDVTERPALHEAKEGTI